MTFCVIVSYASHFVPDVHRNSDQRLINDEKIVLYHFTLTIYLHKIPVMKCVK